MAVPKYFRPAFFARSPRPGSGFDLGLEGVGVAAMRGRRVRMREAFILTVGGRSSDCDSARCFRVRSGICSYIFDLHTIDQQARLEFGVN